LINATPYECGIAVLTFKLNAGQPEFNCNPTES